MLAIAAPGQGAQTPGFVTEWLAIEEFSAAYGDIAARVGLDLVALGTTADADTIRNTEIAQPLLVAAACGAAAALGDVVRSADAVTGHSVGELAAAAIAGVISVGDAGALVARRGQAMARAAAVTPTSMTAVLGGERDEVLAAIAASGATAANDNGPGQIVAAGTVAELEQLLAHPPEKARLIPLSVAGAFHTVHMQPAVAELQAVAAELSPATATIPVISNRDGAVITDGRDVLDRLVGQVATPVRWDLCMEQLQALGVTGLLELPPAGTLTGIARRALKGVETFALKSPDQLSDARDFCRTHAGSKGSA